MTSAQPRFRLHTKHKPELLFAVMRTLAHKDARISFEGRLSHTELANIACASLNETEVLRRNTTLLSWRNIAITLIDRFLRMSKFRLLNGKSLGLERITRNIIDIKRRESIICIYTGKEVVG